MQYKSVKGFTGWGQLGFLFAFLGLGFILAGGAELLFMQKIIPPGAKMTDSKAMMDAMCAPENTNTVRTIQVISSFLLLFIPAFLWSWVSNGRSFFWLGFNKYINVQQLLLAILIIFTANIAATPLEDLSKAITAHFPALDATAKKMEEDYMRIALALTNLHGWGDYIVGLLIMAFLPAMFEEMFFRGVLQNFLTKWLRKPYVAITLSSIIFSLVHASIWLFLSRFVLGFALGLMFYQTRNIWLNILAHFFNNAVTLSALFFSDKKPEAKDLDKLDPHLPWGYGLAGAGVLIGMFVFLHRYSERNKARINAKENLLIAEADPFRSFADAENQPGGDQ